MRKSFRKFKRVFPAGLPREVVEGLRRVSRVSRVSRRPQPAARIVCPNSLPTAYPTIRWAVPHAGLSERWPIHSLAYPHAICPHGSRSPSGILVSALSVFAFAIPVMLHPHGFFSSQLPISYPSIRWSIRKVHSCLRYPMRVFFLSLVWIATW